jgi:outer membrane protein assembly factor BamE (lipoprotein component of BamABCDE complex)
MKSIFLAVFLFSICACSPSQAPKADTSAPSPKPSPTQQVSTTINAEGWKDKGNWKKLKKGMNKWEVTQLLGEPAGIRVGPYTHWYYPESGSVDFKDNKLSVWSESY